MKQFLNFFYILPFKVILVLIIALCSVLSNQGVVKCTYLYKEDSLSVKNVFFQNNNFDYYTSTYLENEIETAIENVLVYSLELSNDDYLLNEESKEYIVSTISYLAKSYVKDKTVDKNFIEAGFITLIPQENRNTLTVEVDGKHYIQSVNEEKIQSAFNHNKSSFIQKYRMYTDEEYRRVTTALSCVEDMQFALVNHGTEKIVSSISEIDGKSSGENIRKYFSGNEKNLLVVHSAKNPYFEKGTMTYYVDFVQELSQKYEDDFDLYISFNDKLTFSTTPEQYAQRHTEVRQELLRCVNQCLFFFLISLMLTVLLTTLAGKRCYKGKDILTPADKIPNDLKFVSLLVVFISMATLYEISLYMVIKSEEDYLFNITSDFYAYRSHLCFAVMVLMVLSIISTIKRQLRHKMLFTNTYIYKFIKRRNGEDPEASQ